MKYAVLYEDNAGNNGTIEYNSAAEAEAAIEEELALVKQEYMNAYGSYDYGDFGSKTEIWVPGNDPYASWNRLWQ